MRRGLAEPARRRLRDHREGRAHQGDIDQERLFTECTLSAGGGSDRARVHVLASDVPEATLPMQLVRNLPSGGTASVSCRDADIDDVRGEQLKITGVELGWAP
jgi:hypothetical protein